MAKNNKKQGKRHKLEIVFDPKNRREFLTGFRKRKNERRKRAQEELAQLIKDEKKRIRQEVKEGVKHLKKSFEPIPEVEDLLREREEEYEDDQVIVKMVELSSSDMASQQNWIGDNFPNTEGNEIEEQQSDASEMKEDEILGMNIVEKREPKKDNGVKKDRDLKTKKELDKMKQKQTAKSMQKSKFFKMKQRFDRLANKKKARKERNQQKRELKKKGIRLPKNKDKKSFPQNNRRRNK